MSSRHSETEGDCSFLSLVVERIMRHPPAADMDSFQSAVSFSRFRTGTGPVKNSTHICYRLLSSLGWKFDNPGNLGGDSGMNASDNGRTERASELPFSIHQHQVNHITRGRTSQSGRNVSPTPLEGDSTGASGRFPTSLSE